MKSTWVEVNLGLLDANIQAVKRGLATGRSIIFVVKDRAYGHGLIPVATRAAQAGVDWFGVVDLDEALQIRKALKTVNILLLGVADATEVGEINRNRIVPVVVSREHGELLAEEARRLNCSLMAHLKVDTGMGRLGVLWEEAAETFKALAMHDGLDLRGLCTHLASVEIKKPSLAPEQIDRFLRVRREIEAHAKKELFCHVSSSRAVLFHGDWDFNAIRPGLVLYGYGSDQKDMRFRTHPILQWKTRVAQVKKVPAHFPVGYYSTYVTTAPTVLVTLAVGYADGYHRALSNKGFVLIKGRRCPVVGRVSMNWITVDAGPDSDVQMGDEVVLIGTQGDEKIWADELGRLARTIPYELLTSINPFARRDYIS